MRTRNRYALNGLAIFLLCIWVLGLSQKHMRQLPGTDAGIFSAVAHELLNGKNLYSEVFESKPPGIFLWNAASLFVFRSGYASIQYAELLLMLILVPLLWRMLRRYQISPLAALLVLCWLFFLWIQPFMYGQGNQTESIALWCVLAGIALMHESAIGRGLGFKILGAFLLGSSFWFRESFAISAFLWFLWLQSGITKKQRLLLWVSASAPGVLLLLWMGPQAAIHNLNVYVSYMQEYFAFAQSEHSELPAIQRWLRIMWNSVAHRQWGIAIFWLAGLFAPFLLRRNNSTLQTLLPFWIPLLLACNLYLTLQSGYMFGHYFLLIHPDLLFLSLWSYRLLDQIGLRYLPRIKGLIPTACIALMLAPVLLNKIPHYLPHFPVTQSYKFDQFTKYIKTHSTSSDRLYVDAAEYGQYYADTRLHSGLTFPLPVFHYFSLPVFGNTPERNAEKQLEQIQGHPPKYVILGKGYSLMFHRSQGIAWFESRYTQVALTSEYSQDLRLFRLHNKQ